MEFQITVPISFHFHIELKKSLRVHRYLRVIDTLFPFFPPLSTLDFVVGAQFHLTISSVTSCMDKVFFCIGWDGEHVTKTKRKGALNKLIIFNVTTCCAVKIYTYKI